MITSSHSCSTQISRFDTSWVQNDSILLGRFGNTFEAQIGASDHWHFPSVALGIFIVRDRNQLACITLKSTGNNIDHSKTIGSLEPHIDLRLCQVYLQGYGERLDAVLGLVKKANIDQDRVFIVEGLRPFTISTETDFYSYTRGFTRKDSILTIYHPKQVPKNCESFSKSPCKAQMLLAFMRERGIDQSLVYSSNFQPFIDEDFRIAHDNKYVDDFFAGRIPNCASITWNQSFADSVRYSNANLYHSINTALSTPWQVILSPTSGFHHAQPQGGSGFCVFSGQVIASVKVYREQRKSGAYIDLDNHFGNSIEDSRQFVPELNNAIPYGCNINPEGSGADYLESLRSSLKALEKQIIQNKIHYIVFAHGADSHKDDDLGGRVSTHDWLACSRIFYEWVRSMDESLGRPLPIVLTLFGGYRSDDFNSVLALHANDILICAELLCDRKMSYVPVIKPREIPKPQ